MKRGIAFFISPKGEVILVRGSHIAEVISNPARFGLSREEIEAAYEKHGEKLGIEGKAREEILRDLIGRGWIRVREYPDSGWSFTVKEVTPEVRRQLQDFARWLLSPDRATTFGPAGFGPDPHLPIRIASLSPDPEMAGEPELTLEDLASAG